jgi:uncharacterized sulfatase
MSLRENGESMKEKTFWKRGMRNRVIIFSMAAAAVSFPQNSSLAAETEFLKRPNIVFAFADDWGRYASAYRKFEGGNSINALIHTPNFDSVARNGVLFKNAFVPAPSCTPCRSSILSGSYFWQTGRAAILQGAVWDSTIPTFPLELEKAGYHIGHTNKVWSPGTPRNAPIGAERTQYMKAGRLFNRFSQAATEMGKEIGTDAAMGKLFDEVRNNFQDFVKARPDDAPFFYWWGPTNTHRKWTAGSGEALWGLDPDKLKGKLPSFLPDVPEVREDVNDYLGEVLAVDVGLGVLLQELKEMGELYNTIVVVSGDHGIPGMPRGKCNLYDYGTAVPLAIKWPARITAGRVVDDFVNLMDLAPTFLEAARVDVPATMTAKSLVPIFGVDEDGLIDRERTFVVTGRERHVAAAREGNLPYPQRALRNRNFLYIRNYEPDRWPMGDPKGLDDPTADAPTYALLRENTFVAYGDLDASPTKAWMVHHRGEDAVRKAYELGFGKYPGEELYDLRVDPDQVENVIDDERYAEVRARMAAQLEGILREQKDPRLVESRVRFEHAPFTNR